MRVVFLDTVGLLALWDRSDQWHRNASAAMAALATSPMPRLVTSTLVLFECGNAAARKAYRADVVDLWEHLQRQADLLIPTERQIEAAWDTYGRGLPADAGIVDHVSFIIMRELGITDAFTNDRHFRAAGFNTLF